MSVITAGGNAVQDCRTLRKEQAFDLFDRLIVEPDLVDGILQVVGVLAWVYVLAMAGAEFQIDF